MSVAGPYEEAASLSVMGRLTGPPRCAELGRKRAGPGQGEPPGSTSDGLDRALLVGVETVPTERGPPISPGPPFLRAPSWVRVPNVDVSAQAPPPGPAAQGPQQTPRVDLAGGNRINEPSLPVAETQAQQGGGRPRPGQSL